MQHYRYKSKIYERTLGTPLQVHKNGFPIMR